MPRESITTKAPLSINALKPLLLVASVCLSGQPHRLTPRTHSPRQLAHIYRLRHFDYLSHSLTHPAVSNRRPLSRAKRKGDTTLMGRVLREGLPACLGPKTTRAAGGGMRTPTTSVNHTVAGVWHVHMYTQALTASAVTSICLARPIPQCNSPTTSMFPVISILVIS